MTTKKLRIAVWHNLPSGGGKRALWHQISGLLARGHQVESWCPPTADTRYLPLNKICREHVVPLAMPGRIKYLSWIADYHLIRSRIEAMRAHSRECAAQIQTGGFDLLLSNSCSRFAMPAIGRYLEIPKAVYLQEPYRRFYEALPELPWAAPAPDESQMVTSLPRLLASTLRLQDFRVQMREEMENAKNFDRILVNSFFSRESVLRAYGLESEVCYNGIDTELFRPLNEPVEKYVIGVGSVNFHKGADRAIRAVAAVPATQRPKLLWVGNDAGNDYVLGLKALAKKLAVDFEVKVMVPDAELVSLLGRAAAMLYTSRLEPFGLAPLEANACGTPVVAIAEGGVRESIVHGENGLLVPDGKPESIAAALNELIENPARAAELRSKCRDAVLSRWSMDAAIERLETALYEVVDDVKTGARAAVHFGNQFQPKPASIRSEDFNPLDSKLLFAQPARLHHESAWNEHVPLAMLLVELFQPQVIVELGTHWGVSYCAWCQAVAASGAQTRCYAVDTWTGDVHAGHYGDEIFKNLQQHHRQYESFSKLLRMSFDEARAQIPDGSVDLLHIDGLHFYEAVKHDFDSWLPKLSRRGVVLLHDTVVTGRGFGVHQLWRELSAQYPHFNFEHGYGLGILAVGREPSEGVTQFLRAANRQPHATRELFATLGGRLQRTVAPPAAVSPGQNPATPPILQRVLRKLKSSLTGRGQESQGSYLRPPAGSGRPGQMNAAGPLVSLCVPTYNGGEFLRDCLASIQAQTLGDFEVVIVDDDSQDGSFEIAAGFARRDPRFLVHRNPNRLGLVENWNRCLDLSRGTWLKLVFQDDLIESRCLERLVESCGRQKQTFAFCDRNFLFDDSVDAASRDYFNQHQAMIQEVYEKQDHMDAGQFARLCAERPGENLIGEPTVALFHRSVIQNCGKFNPVLVQLCDMEYWARVGSNVGVVHVPEKLATFRVHGGSATAHNQAHRAYRKSKLDPLIFKYVLLRNPQCRNIRRAIYRRQGGFAAWWECLYYAHDAWRLARPRLFDSASGDINMKKEWQQVVQVYPGLRLLALVGLFLVKIRTGMQRAGLDRFLKGRPPGTP